MNALMKICLLAAAGASMGLVFLAMAVSGAYFYLAPGLPSVESIREVPLQIPLQAVTRDGRLIGEVGEKLRTPVELEDVPELLRKAFLAAEDDRFFEHPGYDYQGLARAAFNLVLTRSASQGGSTITQQLAREYYVDRERTFVRKARELFVSLRLERELSKEEILELYLNKIFLGNRAYGVAAAAQVYFGKSLEELTIAESATLAGLPKAPSAINPVRNPARAESRRAYVLRRLGELNVTTVIEARCGPGCCAICAPKVFAAMRSCCGSFSRCSRNWALRTPAWRWSWPLARPMRWRCWRRAWGASGCNGIVFSGAPIFRRMRAAPCPQARTTCLPQAT